MQDELTAVCIRKKVLAEPRQQEERSGAKPQKGGHEDESPVDQRSQQELVGEAYSLEPMLECPVKPCKGTPRFSARMFRFEKVHRKGWHQRSREDVRRDHREYH